MNVGVLALQGAFTEHVSVLKKLGVNAFELRQAKDLGKNIDGLILPGGESTVQGKLLRDLDMFDKIRKMITEGMPVFGTCAGLILLAKNIANDDKRHIAAMDITAVRNAYGRQLGSFRTVSEFKGIGKIPMTFIRAPFIESAGKNVETLATVDGRIVAAKENNMLVTAFHPELDEDLSVHRYFLKMIG